MDAERFGGTIGTTIHDSTAWWPEPTETAGRAHQRAAGAARRRRVRRLRLLRLGDRHADDRRARRRRPPLHRLPHHRDVLDHPRRAAHRPEPPLGRDGLPGELRQRVPRLPGQDRRRRPTIAELLRPHGYRNYLVGKWHVTPAHRDRADRAVRRLAARPRVRPLLRVPRRRDRPVLPRTRARQHPRHRTRRLLDRLPPHRRPDRRGDRLPRRPCRCDPRRPVVPDAHARAPATRRTRRRAT